MAEENEAVVQRLAALPTTGGLAARLAVAELSRQGIDPSPLLARAGLSLIALDQRVRIDSMRQMEFVGLVSQRVGDGFIGLTMAENFDLRELGMLYYVAGSSNRLGDALHRLERYARLGNEALALRISKGTACRIVLSYAGVPRYLDHHQMEGFALTIVRLVRQFVGHKVSPLEARFAHHRSGDLSRARNLLGCDVIFGTDADELRFDPALLDRRLIADDQFLNRLMVEDCEQAIAERPTSVSPLRTMVENTIAPLLPHAEASAKKVAACLGFSERTFARRLAAEGLSFGEILDGLRRDLAIRYLAEAGLQISQISWMLGFHHLSAFSHACHRWTDKSPSQFRRELSSA